MLQGTDAAAFERLPLLDREVIARHGIPAFLTVGEAGLITTTTSGSTGTPGRFLRSSVDEAEFSARWNRVYRAFGCNAFSTQVNIASIGRPPRAGAVNALRSMGVLPRIEAVASNAPPDQMLQRMLELSPSILTGFAAAVEALADHVLDTGTRLRPPRAVFCTAMEVTDRCLEVAARAFEAPAVDVYVTNELGVIAWSCPVRNDRLHVNDDTMLVEVIRQDGTPAALEEQGEVIVTNLGLRAMPLIRYRMGDLAARLPGRCECGRGLGLMTRVQGRTAHVFRRSGGAVITTPTVTSLVGQAHGYEWVRRFQVVEEPDYRLRALLEVRRQPTPDQLDLLTNTLQRGLGPDFRIACTIVDHIPLAPSGKLQFLVPLPARS